MMLGLSKDQGTNFLKLAERAESFLKSKKALPAATSTLLKLTYLSEDQFVTAVNDESIRPKMKFADAARLVDPIITPYYPLPEPGQKKGKRKRIKHPKIPVPETIPELQKELRRMQRVIDMDREVIKQLNSRHHSWTNFFSHEYETFNDKLDELDRRLANLIPDPEYEFLLKFCDPSNFGEMKERAKVALEIVKTLRDHTERKSIPKAGDPESPDPALKQPWETVISVPDTDDTEDN